MADGSIIHELMQYIHIPLRILGNMLDTICLFHDNGFQYHVFHLFWCCEMCKYHS